MIAGACCLFNFLSEVVRVRAWSRLGGAQNGWLERSTTGFGLSASGDACVDACELLGHVLVCSSWIWGGTFGLDSRLRQNGLPSWTGF